MLSFYLPNLNKIYKIYIMHVDITQQAPKSCKRSLY
jgi:hypothetical protein